MGKYELRLILDHYISGKCTIHSPLSAILKFSRCTDRTSSGQPVLLIQIKYINLEVKGTSAEARRNGQVVVFGKSSELTFIKGQIVTSFKICHPMVNQ